MITLPVILLMSFILNLGIATGAGFYESKIVLPLWFRRSADKKYSVNTQAMQQIDTGRKFWAMVTTIPLTLQTLINLFMAFQTSGDMQCWWLAALFITMAERIATFAFFIPTAIKLQHADTLAADKVHSLTSRWVGLNNARLMMNMLAFIAGLIALAMSGAAV